MSSHTSDTRISVAIDEATSVRALLRLPAAPRVCYVFAHGAGAGMDHPFMHAVADGLGERAVATLRFQFPYMDKGSKRPDSPVVAHAAVRAACKAAYQATSLPLIAGGKSFGGRMTSQAQALAPIPNVAGLAFVGFPLHPAGKPSTDRAKHLADVHVPMFFIQGTRDKLAELSLLTQVVSALGRNSQLLRIQHADHGFDVLVRSGRKPADVMDEVLDGLAAWIVRAAQRSH